jgi:hypothetical protein
MKHNSSNQSIQSQKKVGGITGIRKLGGNIALDQSFNNQSMHNNGNQSHLTNKNSSYKYINPY